MSSGFFVPDNAAHGHPWIAWTEVWTGLATLTGPPVPWIALASAIAILVVFISSRRGADRALVLLPLALAACAALPWSAYLSGHPVRVRYDVPLIGAAAALIGMAVALLPRQFRAVAAIGVVGIAVWQAPPFDTRAPVVVESQREAPETAARRGLTAYLAANWDGQPIMMSMGSLADYMHDLSASGFRIRDFLQEGNGELWKTAERTPRPFVEWIAIQQKEDRDELFRIARRDPRFLSGYTDGPKVAKTLRRSRNCRSSHRDRSSSPEILPMPGSSLPLSASGVRRRR